MVQVSVRDNLNPPCLGRSSKRLCDADGSSTTTHPRGGGSRPFSVEICKLAPSEMGSLREFNTSNII